MTALDAVFKAYDIRGTVPEQLDEAMCHAIGLAFARFAGAGRILVGHDMRPSGHGLVAAFCDGVQGEGVDVVHLGLVSTDLVYYAAGRFDAPGAMFTASHNPAQYNGIKLCLAGARPVGADTGLGEIQATAEGVLAGTVAPGTRSPGRGVEDGSPRRLRRPCGLVRRPVAAQAAQGRGRHRQRHGRSRRAQGLRTPAVRSRDDVRRARRHLPEPPGRPDPAGQPARPPGPGRGRRRRRRARLRRRRRPGLLRRRDRAGPVGLHHHRHPRGRHPRPGAGRHHPAQPHLLAGRP